MRARSRMHVTRGSPAFFFFFFCTSSTSEISNIKMGNTSNSHLTDEADLAMFNSSLEDIQSRFATLLISVRSALEANHYPTSDIRSILVGMFAGSDDYIPRINLEEIFLMLQLAIDYGIISTIVQWRICFIDAYLITFL